MQLTYVLIYAVVLAAVSVAAAGLIDDKNHKTHSQESGPKAGVKTPGVQMPIARLKTEAEIPAPSKPAWMYFSVGLFFPSATGLDKVDLKTNKTGDPVVGLDKPCGMASAFGSLWVADCGTQSLVRLESKTVKALTRIKGGVASARGVIAASPDSIWLLTDNKTTLSRIDPDQDQIVAETRVHEGCTGLAFGENWLWLACPEQNKVLRVNPATNLVEKRVDVSAQPQAIAVAEGSVWVLCRKDGKIDRIDPKTDKVTKTIDLGVLGAAGAIAAGDGAIWVTMTGFPLTRIDPKDESVTHQFYGDGGGAIATSPGAIWLSNLNQQTISRIDPKRVLATLAE